MRESDDELITRLKKRDNAFLWRLFFRVGVVVLGLVWLFIAAPTGCVGEWVANGFESFTEE